MLAVDLSQGIVGTECLEAGRMAVKYQCVNVLSLVLLVALSLMQPFSVQEVPLSIVSIMGTESQSVPRKVSRATVSAVDTSEAYLQPRFHYSETWFHMGRLVQEKTDPWNRLCLGGAAHKGVGGVTINQHWIYGQNPLKLHWRTSEAARAALSLKQTQSHLWVSLNNVMWLTLISSGLVSMDILTTPSLGDDMLFCKADS